MIYDDADDKTGNISNIYRNRYTAVKYRPIHLYL